ncbi:hypothetical protein [Rufibacter aurantiacus]|uniref:hypothetical protein n=1 Tax=Rufibacter aurantiacus TaxID=2817374 RepID=UPI001B316973|nr:hypothetical protein [Rufibacter aurantiacus]
MSKYLKHILLGYLLLVLGYFTYAGFTGTRFLGDDKEESENGGSRSSGSYRRHTFYHK